ncbi:MAG: hypothetical protein KC910_01770 [Candidatus Eremiobacteraeota bacterium]|nr:hypothetical protein [Candidatus Eremiobacteraeota bacterium]
MINTSFRLTTVGLVRRAPLAARPELSDPTETVQLSRPRPLGLKQLGLALTLGLAVALTPVASLAQCTVHKNPMANSWEMAPQDAVPTPNPIEGTWELASPKAKPVLNPHTHKMEMVGEGEHLMYVSNPMTGEIGWQFCK